MMETILKYPRTPHLEGSRLQPGDEDLSQVPYADLAGKHIVVEEKLDGANSGIRFSPEASMLLQSRGHYLTGGAREKHFALMKTWAAAHEETLFDLLGDRFQMYGEWMACKHTVFYDALPHYFLEFDIYDFHNECFLSTQARQDLIGDAPILPVPVLYEGIAPRRLEDLLGYIRPSLAKTSNWRAVLRTLAERQGLDAERILSETEDAELAEGLYLKIEEGGKTIGRLKWVRSGFLQAISSSDSHWLSRPIIPNQLADGADLYAPRLTVRWGEA